MRNNLFNADSFLTLKGERFEIYIGAIQIPFLSFFDRGQASDVNPAKVK